MIGSIRGRLLRKEASEILVETGGVGYLLHVPFSTFFELPAVGGEASLHVHTHVRDDAIQLYGFASDLELKVFHRLIAVNGVGPKMAVTILSGIPAGELAQAIRSGDLKRLMAVPGLGRKTSERLVVELRDKLDDLLLPPPPRLPRTSPHRDDAVSALVNLGYRQKDAEAAVDRVTDRNPDSLEVLLRAALAILAR